MCLPYIRSDKGVSEIYDATKQKKISWRPVQFAEEGSGWVISFKARWNGRRLVLEKRHSVEYGGYVSRDICDLTAYKKGEKKLSVGYLKDEDYVETLSVTGDPTLGLLARDLIDKFRKKLKLHWSVM